MDHVACVFMASQMEEELNKVVFALPTGPGNGKAGEYIAEAIFDRVMARTPKPPPVRSLFLAALLTLCLTIVLIMTGYQLGSFDQPRFVIAEIEICVVRAWCGTVKLFIKTSMYTNIQAHH